MEDGKSNTLEDLAQKLVTTDLIKVGMTYQCYPRNLTP